MKRLLIISYYWPPTGGSGVQRWVKFSKYLPSLGWQPVIYTPLNPEQLARDESLLADIPECAEVLKTSILEPYELYRRLSGKRGSNEVNPINASNLGRASLVKRISLWIRGNLFIPDPRITWRRKSLKFLRQYLRNHPVDAVITTGPPQSMHLIGLDLKKALGVKWIADFRDPWTQMFYYKHLHLSAHSDRLHHKLEQQVLDTADAIIAVSPLVRDDFAASTATPIQLITNGFDEDDFVNSDSSPSSNCAKSRNVDQFRIVHTGLFAADGNPLELWKALAELCAEDSAFKQRLQIRLAGKTDAEIIRSIESEGLGDNLINLGYLPHEEIVKEQRDADLLILPLRQEPEYAKVLPGKIFEYLAARRPVLGIGQSDGAAAAVLKDAGAGVMYDWHCKQEMKEYIVSPIFTPKGIDKYTRRALTEQLVGLLNSLSGN